jgi:hypothetical protein
LLVASLEFLDCVFDSHELALQAGDCLIQPRFAAFDIESAPMVVVFCHGSVIRRCAQTARGIGT